MIKCVFKKKQAYYIHSTQEIGMTHASLIPCPIKAYDQFSSTAFWQVSTTAPAPVFTASPTSSASGTPTPKADVWLAKSTVGYFHKKEQQELITSEF